MMVFICPHRGVSGLSCYVLFARTIGLTESRTMSNFCSPRVNGVSRMWDILTVVQLSPMEFSGHCFCVCFYNHSFRVVYHALLFIALRCLIQQQDYYGQ